MALTRAQVVAAALEILDEYGLGDLTMRRLAGSLGVQPGALYWHVANKQALLADVADAIVAELSLPTTGDDPTGSTPRPPGDAAAAPGVRPVAGPRRALAAAADEHGALPTAAGAPRALAAAVDEHGALPAVAGWARALRRTLLAHRDGAEVVAAAYALRSDEDPTVAALTDGVRAAGVPGVHAAAGAAALVHYVLGHTAHEQWHAQLTAAPAVARAGLDADERFELGLALLLDGLALRTVEQPG
ncbi:TetR/AcrR family transcriptional regulator C-terminal domain-containing protein [Cellulomonas sp. NPDC055163]